ncbi:amidohydrolase [Spirulina major CS-329]|uniref:amidohydrolase n=1 Tax=Spirulina TaxID=1154 RepID=UPI0023307CE7|nr:MULTISPECIES: amidohydrolase [Spirulina]MDB9495997.1 amidohydrolase [Spirulina subsalsa CS-330]MDB9502900.1 amidohydrolase [Spirulina major CS-329]
MSFTIQNVLSPTADGYETLDIYIEGEAIAAVAPHLDPQGTVIDGSNHLVLPGFVNAHTHSSELWQRGAIAPYPLELWIAELHEFSPINPEQVYLSAVGTAVETLQTGGTCVVDHLVLIPGQELATIEATVRGYRDVGIRAFIGPLIQDEVLAAAIPQQDQAQEYGSFYRTTAEILEMMATAVERFHRPEEGISIMVAPTGTQLCSDVLFKGCIELSDRYNLRRHAHLLETKAQQMLAAEKYGCSAVEHLEKLGYLGDRTSLAHCIWLSDRDIEIMAATGTTVVHNPLSNLRLGSGIAPILKYRAAGVNVAIGCDGTASNDSQDVLEAIKIGTLIHNTTDLDYRHWITPREAVQIAALGGAKGLKMSDRFGSLTVGKQADLVLYDLTNLSLLPKTDPVGLLVMGRPTQVVNYAWVRGQPVIADGKFTRVDVDKLRHDLFTHSEWIEQRTSTHRAQLEAHYRHVMGLEP